MKCDANQTEKEKESTTQNDRKYEAPLFAFNGLWSFL